MSIQQLKELFGNQEAVLELVQLEGGELALRNAGSEKEPLVKIQFSDELKAILGEQTPIVAQHMIQAALFGLLEKQVNEWQAEVVDEQPKFLSKKSVLLSTLFVCINDVWTDAQVRFDLKYDGSYS